MIQSVHNEHGMQQCAWATKREADIPTDSRATATVGTIVVLLPLQYYQISAYLVL
jgi:hypothetical protein